MMCFADSQCGILSCRCMHHDSSCCVTQQIFLQSVVFGCLLLLGNMALSGSKSLTHYCRCYKQEIKSTNVSTE